MKKRINHLVKSGIFGVVFSVLLLLMGTFFTTVYAIINQLDLEISNIYNITVESNGGFQVSMGPGFFFTGMIVTAFFTLLFFIGQMYVDMNNSDKTNT